MKHKFHIGLVVLDFLAKGCLAASVAAGSIPEALAVAGDMRMSVEADGEGVQVYQCNAAPTQLPPYSWKFVAPEATLNDSAGRLIARHYAGPTWEATDGSKIIGTVLTQIPSPDHGSIPWLLLSVKSTAGPGTFSEARLVRRVLTNGGVAPSSGCDASHLLLFSRVPYTAVYQFYNAKPQ